MSLAETPNQRAIEVVYGGDVQGRGIEESAPLGVSAAAASFKEGNLMDGLISAVLMVLGTGHFWVFVSLALDLFSNFRGLHIAQRS